MILKKALVTLVTLFVLNITDFAHAEEYGTFEGQIISVWDQDGRTMTLTQPIKYTDPDKKEWKVPEGTSVDGASIPKAFWSIIGGPFEGTYREASVIHDHFCVTRTEDWRDVHKMFYLAMRAKGTSIVKAKAMYYAVLVGGPRWKNVYHTNHEPRAFAKPGDIDEYRLISWEVSEPSQTSIEIAEMIEKSNPSIEEIEVLAANAFLGNEPPSKIRID